MCLGLMSLVRRTVWFVAAATSATVLTLAATALLVNVSIIPASRRISYICSVCVLCSTDPPTHHFGLDLIFLSRPFQV
jgi:hypothetical protein